MKTTKFILLLFCFIGSFNTSAQKQEIANIKQVPDKVKFRIVEPKTASLLMIMEYSYDLKGRLTQIKSANNRYTFNYSYNNKEQVSSIQIIYDDNRYVQADFTYGASGKITSVKRSGSQQGTFNPYYYGKEKVYKWKDPYGRDNIISMSYADNTVSEHKIGNDTFTFTYEKSIRNGIENLASPVSLQTYLAMDYSVTTLFEEGFLNVIMGKVLQSYKDSRGKSRLFVFSNETKDFNYLKSSTVPVVGSTLYSIEPSYRTAPEKLEIKIKSTDKIKKIDKIDLKK